MVSKSTTEINHMADNLENARSQALAQFNSIREMVLTLREARESQEPDAIEDAERVIHEDALSVELRSGWYTPDSQAGAESRAAEFKILLCTGGPAVQIVGDLDEYGEPESATMQFQDWFTPWTDWNGDDISVPDDYREILLDYCRVFYFGE